MRKFLIPAVGVLALAAVEVAPTIAQDSSTPTSLKVDATVSPSKAGTKKKPKGVKLTFKATWATTGDVEHPIIQTGDVLFPKGSLYNGAKYTKCAEATLQRGGPGACPSKSIMGTGTGDALADLTHTTPKITVINGGATRVYFWTVLTNPARVQTAVVGKISKPGGKWAYKLHFEVPKSLQIVAGIPITLNNLKVTVGGKSYAKDWLATTSCPANKKWPFQVETTLSTGGSSTYQDTVACK
jgi:hypothetical protein